MAGVKKILPDKDYLAKVQKEIGKYSKPKRERRMKNEKT